MSTQEAEGLPGITMWDIARSLGQLETMLSGATREWTGQTREWIG